MAEAASFPVSISSLLLPTASQNFSGTLSSIKRSTLSTNNRLQSIYHDSGFVQDVARDYGLPLIANERCGSWYIPSEQNAGSAYFKSTDGHWGQWSFSTRRLNLQTFQIIGRCGGCIIVDSTRRGKSMPDALSKTVPIWCAVINRLLFEDVILSQQLYTPAEVVSASEHAQIEARIDGFVADAKSLGLDLLSLRSSLKKPLRPYWITPDYSFPKQSFSSIEFHSIICCTASHRVVGAEISENGYIQGAGDDSEGWSYGLTPILFWKHASQLRRTMEENVAVTIRNIIGADRDLVIGNDSAVRLGSTNLYVGTLSDATKDGSYDGIVVCSGTHPQSSDPNILGQGQRKILHFLCSDGKTGSRALRNHLPRLRPFIASLPLHHTESPKILFACSTGKDLSVGVALAVLSMFFDDDYRYFYNLYDKVIDKTMVRRRLVYVSVAKPDASPSRSTLQSIHGFLMPRCR